MEFWGIEVKPGDIAFCDPGVDTYLHLSQLALGETKKPSENVLVYLTVEGQELVLGTLSGEKFPQASYDLVLQKDFKVSHSSKHTSVYVSGYKSAMIEGESDDFTDSGNSESEDEPIPLEQNANGKLEVKVKKTSGKGEAKADGSSAKLKANAVLKSGTRKPEESESESETESGTDDDDDESEDDDSVSDNEDMPEAGDDSDDDDDEDVSSDEDVTPQKAEVGKKRASSASKTPVSDKKAKLVTPVGKKIDADGKKGGHTATPYPKQAAKISGTKEKSKQQSPKSGGAVSCKSCTKTFTSESALQSHTKAKHEAK